MALVVTATAGPAVLDGLLALARASVGDDVGVVDGFDLQPAEATVLTIGLSDPTDITGTPAVSSRQEPMGGFGDERRETLVVRCRISTNEPEPKAARDYLLHKLGLFDEALRADRSLGGRATEAHLGPDFDLHQADNSTGGEARYDFTISIDCYLT